MDTFKTFKSSKVVLQNIILTIWMVNAMVCCYTLLSFGTIKCFVILIAIATLVQFEGGDTNFMNVVMLVIAALI